LRISSPALSKISCSVDTVEKPNFRIFPASQRLVIFVLGFLREVFSRLQNNLIDYELTAVSDQTQRD